jgi:hypothetical protein
VGFFFLGDIMSDTTQTVRHYSRIYHDTAARCLSLGLAAMGLYVILSRYCGAKTYCWPTITSLAQQAGCSRQTVIDILYKLAEAGLIKVEHRPNRSNCYHLVETTTPVQTSNSPKSAPPAPTPQTTGAQILGAKEIQGKKEIENTTPPVCVQKPNDQTAEEAVWQAWAKGRHTQRPPSASDRRVLTDIVSQYGPRASRVVHMLSVVIESRWPDCATLSGAWGSRYREEVAAIIVQEDRQRAETAERERQREADEARRQREREFVARWQPIWAKLGEDERDEIRRAVIGRHPSYADRPCGVGFEYNCLMILAERSGEAAPA